MTRSTGMSAGQSTGTVLPYLLQHRYCTYVAVCVDFSKPRLKKIQETCWRFDDPSLLSRFPPFLCWYILYARVRHSRACITTTWNGTIFVFFLCRVSVLIVHSLSSALPVLYVLYQWCSRTINEAFNWTDKSSSSSSSSNNNNNNNNKHTSPPQSLASRQERENRWRWRWA